LAETIKDSTNSTKNKAKTSDYLEIKVASLTTLEFADDDSSCLWNVKRYFVQTFVFISFGVFHDGRMFFAWLCCWPSFTLL